MPNFDPPKRISYIYLLCRFYFQKDWVVCLPTKCCRFAFLVWEEIPAPNQVTIMHAKHIIWRKTPRNLIFWHKTQCNPLEHLVLWLASVVALVLAISIHQRPPHQLNPFSLSCTFHPTVAIKYKAFDPSIACYLLRKPPCTHPHNAMAPALQLVKTWIHIL